MMKAFEYTITDPVGIHARPAGTLVKTAGKFISRITISCKDRQCEAKQLMMGMGITPGDTIQVTIEGEDEETAAAELEAFLREKL